MPSPQFSARLSRSPFGPLPSESGLFYDPVMRIGLSWIEPQGNVQDDLQCEEPSSPEMADLIRATAGIVAIAAERARQTGDLMALRDAVDRMLGKTPNETESGPDPREAELPQPPVIQDSDPRTESERLAALMRRQAAR